MNDQTIHSDHHDELAVPDFFGDHLDEASALGQDDAERWGQIAKRADLFHMHVTFFERCNPHLGKEGEAYLNSIGVEPNPDISMTGTEFYRWLRTSYPQVEPSVHPNGRCGRDVLLEAWAIAFEKTAARLWHMHADEPDFGK